MMSADSVFNKIASLPAGALSGRDVARDFSGRECLNQPHGDQLLFLGRSPMSSGCELQSFQSPPASAGDLDVHKIYQEIRPSVGYFSVTGKTDGRGKEPAGIEKHWGGTGVIVAKGKDECLVITDDHVPVNVPDMHVVPTDMTVTMANGKAYPATTVTRDQAHDLGLVRVDTAGDTNSVCRPARIVDKPIVADGSQNVITLGQPYTSQSIYTSIGTIESKEKRSSLNNLILPLPGEDANRDILNMLMPIREGFSGGAVFDSQGRVAAINDVATSPFTSVSTPVTRTVVDDLIARRTDKP